MRLRNATLDDVELLRRWGQQAHVKATTGGGNWRWEVELTPYPDWREL